MEGLSQEVTRFLLELLESQRLHVGDPNFDKLVSVIQQARRELQKELQ